MEVLFFSIGETAGRRRAGRTRSCRVGLTVRDAEGRSASKSSSPRAPPFSKGTASAATAVFENHRNTAVRKKVTWQILRSRRGLPGRRHRPGLDGSVLLPGSYCRMAHEAYASGRRATVSWSRRLSRRRPVCLDLHFLPDFGADLHRSEDCLEHCFSCAGVLRHVSGLPRFMQVIDIESFRFWPVVCSLSGVKRTTCGSER